MATILMVGYFGRNDTLKLTNLLRLKSFEQLSCVWKVMLSPGDGRRGFRGWSDFRQLLLERFRTLQEGTLLDQLFALHQSSYVRKFHRHFEEVADAVLESAFVNGLREDLRVELRLWSPMGLQQIMRIAQQIEDKNVAVQAQKTGLFIPMSKSPSSGFHSSTRTIHT